MRCAVLLITVAVGTGCVTPYEPLSYSGGYHTSEVSPGLYKISVYGNGFTDLPTLESYFHRQAAEVCTGKGFPFYDFEMESHFDSTPGAIHVGKSYGGDTVVRQDPNIDKGRVTGLVKCSDMDPRAQR